MTTVLADPVISYIDSILIPELEGGVVFLTGPKGIGKSSLSHTFDRPELVCFLDYDSGKSAVIDRQMHFGRYEDMMSQATSAVSAGGTTPTEQRVYELTDRIVSTMPKNRYTVVVLDNISNLEDALRWEVATHPRLYGVKPENITSGAFGGVAPGVKRLISSLVSTLHSRGVKLVVAIAHVGSAWGLKGPVPNKWRPKGSEGWQVMSVLTLGLIPSVRGKRIPSAIVWKEGVGQQRFNPITLEHEVVPTLPAKLPEATVKAIKHYLYTAPADPENPQADEVVTDEDMAMWGEKYSKEQLALMLAAAKDSDEREQTTVAFDIPVLDPAEAKAALDEHKSLPAAAKALSDKLGWQVKPADVNSAVQKVLSVKDNGNG